ncbi:hypothetical protein HYT25_01495 [Candidatus Pacearchaeota archaeon]|nr:hypothetical protein [Candidatus Pacearchaeota archaeon]
MITIKKFLAGFPLGLGGLKCGMYGTLKKTPDGYVCSLKVCPYDKRDSELSEDNEICMTNGYIDFADVINNGRIPKPVNVRKILRDDVINGPQNPLLL